jgi:4-hydroxy-tetrahydrodipicolinate reductase
MSPALKIAVVGCAGRMGRMLLREALAMPGCTVSGGTERSGSAHLGCDLGTLAGGAPLGVAATDDVAAVFAAADAVIDFTAPDATAGHAALAARHGTALIVGTTGLQAPHHEALAEAAKTVAVVQAPNMSVGVNLLFALTERVAATLGIDYDIEIVEMHHRHKVDAPSGTALGLGRAAAAGRGVPLDSVYEAVRDGHTGARKPGNIGFATLRGGDVVGDHTVVFAGAGERVELTHKASDRSIFAKGAVRAALWCRDRPAGAYSMLDVLGLG